MTNNCKRMLRKVAFKGGAKGIANALAKRIDKAVANPAKYRKTLAAISANGAVSSKKIKDLMQRLSSRENAMQAIRNYDLANSDALTRFNIRDMPPLTFGASESPTITTTAVDGSPLSSLLSSFVGIGPYEYTNNWADAIRNRTKAGSKLLYNSDLGKERISVRLPEKGYPIRFKDAATLEKKLPSLLDKRVKLLNTGKESLPTKITDFVRALIDSL